MKKITISELMIVPVIVGLIFTMFINGLTLITGGSETIGMFLSFYSKGGVAELPVFASPVLICVAVLQLVATVVLAVALAQRVLLSVKVGKLLNWGILSAIVSVVLYGFAVRMISNHQAAANLFFYTGLLYVLLWYVERQSTGNSPLFERVKLLPLLFTLMYTMGQPGAQKLFNAQAVVPKYVDMFKDSFLAQLPGGIPPFIYMLGVFELLVFVLAVVALLRREFLPGSSKLFLSLSLLIGSLTFIMLAFGLSVLLNYPGATNLMFYAVFCIFFYAYAVLGTDKKR